jgi:hypothetical protein
MYETPTRPRDAGRQLEVPAGIDPALAARLALARVRKVQTAFVPSMSVAPERLIQALERPLDEPVLQRERLFALGWLHWLRGELPVAARLLAEGEARARSAPADEQAPAWPELPTLEPGLLLARLAYWNARVRLLLDQPGAIADYEALLRRLGGSPQATAWYVDLLWRGGRVDRAEQVWKSVRGNKRVLACDEGFLLDARPLLRKGELGQAEKLLREAAPAGGVVWVERYLLWAWALAGLRQAERAAELLVFARQGPYPERARASWEEALAARREGRLPAPTEVPSAWRDFLRGQQERAAGRLAEAEATYRAALSLAATAPFARYGLVCLGKEEAGAALTAAQGMFFVTRLRARHAVERFAHREGSPAELLDSLHHAQAGGYQPAGVEHARRLAEQLQQRQPDPAALAALVAEQESEPARRNALRVVLEAAGRRLAPEAALPLLREPAVQEVARASDDLRSALGRLLLQVALLTNKFGIIDEAAELIPEEPALALARRLLGPAQDAPADDPLSQLWTLARALSEQKALDEPAREHLKSLAQDSSCRPLAQALLTQDAAQRGDLTALTALLEDVDAWRGFRTAPPAFVLHAVEAVASAQPAHPAWRRVLPRWLGLWNSDSLGAAANSLAALAGMGGPAGAAPAGVAAEAWFLHQAARALQRNDPRAALACVEKVADPAALPEGPVVQVALPLLVRLARAQALADCAAGVATGEQLVDMVDLLEGVPGGLDVLHAALRDDRDAVHAALAGLVERTDLPARLYHHLAILATRQAEDEDSPRPGAWRQAWSAWLAFLAGSDAPATARGALLDHLLGIHRRRINELLGQDAFDTARQHWQQVQALPDLAVARAPALGDDLAGRVARFRDDLATEYLVTTREAMRFGDVPEGWRADYTRGLTLLRRLLSLDSDNPRLLTALVETCVEWFLDLYHLHDAPGLREQIDRCIPFALQLARLVEGQPGHLAARSALSEFCKFRGFVEVDRDRKASLYRDALRFNPGNSNVRDLLSELGEPPDPPEMNHA